MRQSVILHDTVGRYIYSTVRSRNELSCIVHYLGHMLTLFFLHLHVFSVYDVIINKTIAACCACRYLHYGLY